MQLMELHFVKMFRDAGVSFQYIRKAANTASGMFNAKYPFTVKKFDTDGKSIFATMKSKSTEKIIVQDMDKGQLVFRTIIKPFFKKLEYSSTSDAERFRPLSKRGRVFLIQRGGLANPLTQLRGFRRGRSCKLLPLGMVRM